MANVPRYRSISLLLVLLGAATISRAEPMTERERWLAYIEQERIRTQGNNRRAVANSYLSPGLPFADDEGDGVPDRILNDSGLRHGDIVSTRAGLFRFVGRDDADTHRVEDFVALSRQVHPR